MPSVYYFKMKLAAPFIYFSSEKLSSYYVLFAAQKSLYPHSALPLQWVVGK